MRYLISLSALRIGVDDTGKILGVQIGKDTIENLANGISQNTELKIHPKIRVEEIDGKKIILVEAKESAEIYSQNWRDYK